MAKKQFTSEEARRIGDQIGVDWDKIPLEEFRMGLAVELEHGVHDVQTNVSDDDEIVTGKIALAHLKEFPDYYTRLEQMEQEAEAYWDAQEG
ncbi:MAG: DUF5661 family protein [Anaerolineales bacterium]